MKTRTIFIALASLFLLSLTTCKKDPQPIMEHFDLSREDLTVGTTSASIVGTYAYSGTIDEITVCVSENGVHPATFVADINGKNFAVEMTGLQPATSYQYYYSVDYGFSKPFITETKLFTTLGELPTVRTIDVTSIDSITVRVKCEVVAEGGQEVTERGICWNTFGDPTLDDETLQHASGGVGQYLLRIDNLDMGMKYYVRAYAKNASGIGFGEELVFKTAAPYGTPVSIELSSNPENGGTVSGGGLFTVGSLCTVTAVANSGYTFVNWTENGNQVSTDASYTFNVTNECHFVANFTTQTHVITAEVTPNNSGTVTGAGGYHHGEECTLIATAKSGYDFVKWTKNGTDVSTSTSFTFVVTASATYVAHFQAKSYTISVSAQPSNGGTVSGGGSYDYGQSCTVQAVPDQGYAFINWTDGGVVVSSDADYSFIVNGNRSLVANFAYSGGGIPPGAINGLFTINANGDQVYFSQGNLQYQPSTNTWNFAENQYEYVGNGNANISPTYNGWIDLFGWGTGNNPTNSSSGYNDYSSFREWGDNAISNGGNQAGLWRTLTKEEWHYILNQRVTPSGKRYAKAQVDGVNGVIVLPDNWSNSTYNIYNAHDASNFTNYTDNVFTVSEWIVLEQAGAVFLPAAGNRYQSSVGNLNSNGYYWSASYYDTFNAYGMTFAAAGLISMYQSHRQNGYSVRLVSPAY